MAKTAVFAPSQSLSRLPPSFFIYYNEWECLDLFCRFWYTVFG